MSESKNIFKNIDQAEILGKLPEMKKINGNEENPYKIKLSLSHKFQVCRKHPYGG